MATIAQAQDLIIKARALREAGEFSSAAKCAISAQRIAGQSRARIAPDVAWTAHNVIASCQMRAQTQTDRSNVGRAMGESRLIGW